MALNMYVYCMCVQTHVHVVKHYVPMNKNKFDIIQWHQKAVYLELWFGLIWKIWMFQKECFKLQVQSTNTSEICKCWDTQAAAVEVNMRIISRYGGLFSMGAMDNWLNMIADIYIFDKYGNFWTSKYIIWGDDGNS